jgi:hypothetical protein
MPTVPHFTHNAQRHAHDMARRNSLGRGGGASRDFSVDGVTRRSPQRGRRRRHLAEFYGQQPKFCADE